MYPADTTSGRATIEPFSSAFDEMRDVDETRADDEPIPGGLEVSGR